MTSTDVPRDVRSMTKAVLTDADLPTHWYNLAADLPVPMPPYLHPGTGQPLEAADMAPLFPAALIEQEMTTERFVAGVSAPPSIPTVAVLARARVPPDPVNCAKTGAGRSAWCPVTCS